MYTVDKIINTISEVKRPNRTNIIDKAMANFEEAFIGTATELKNNQKLWREQGLQEYYKAIKMKKELDTAEAFLLGMIAWGNDKKAIPAQDKALMTLIDKSNCNEIGSSIPLIDAWRNGWHSCNILSK